VLPWSSYTGRQVIVAAVRFEGKWLSSCSPVCRSNAVVACHEVASDWDWDWDCAVALATDVAAKDITGTSDPYAVVHLIENSPAASKVVHSSTVTVMHCLLDRSMTQHSLHDIEHAWTALHAGSSASQ
jgi:hypothetical protein